MGYQESILKVLDNQSSDSIPECFTPTKASKLTLKNPNAFSLPAGPLVCIGMTEACKDCYAQSGNHHYPAVQNAYVRNLRKFNEHMVRDDIEGCVDSLLEIVPAKGNFRIYESGDYANQFMVDVWTEVIRSAPKTQFWGYTRSFELDFTEMRKLSNMTLFASSDNYNEKEANDFAFKYVIKKAFGPWTKDTIPENSFLCPAVKGKLKGVKGACQKCKLCFGGKLKKNVVFPRH
jgi:hypothetical protein